MSQLNSIVAGWKSHFFSADQDIEWIDAERPAHAWLHEELLLVGVIDAIGRTSDGEFFFGEWKTANPREKKTWKQVWRKNPQSLTYGVLIDSDPSILPACNRFSVRKAFKETVPTFDHAWYKYEPAELRHWRTELCGIASEIKGYMREELKPWPTNFARCFQFGVNYECPFFASGCDRQSWDQRLTVLPPRETNPLSPGTLASPVGPDAAVQLVKEQLALYPNRKNVVVLSASQVGTWLGCREQFRKLYVEGNLVPASDALTLGGDFHAAIAEYYKTLIVAKAGQAPEPLTKFMAGVTDGQK